MQKTDREARDVAAMETPPAGSGEAPSQRVPSTERTASARPCVTALLRSADLRPTRQRIALGGLLFSGPDRHVTAEMLHEEVNAKGESISLATVYNTLHQFQRAGLVRELAIDGAKTYFDTNTSNHNHFYIENEGRVIDIPGARITVEGLPEAPAGTRISHIDVVVRLVKTS